MSDFNTYKAITKDIITHELERQWFSQGHRLTNKLINDLKVEIVERVGTVMIDVYMYNYGSYMDRGVKAANVPYQRGSGAGKSLYIEGLKRYVMLRMGLDDKKALGVAFAIATKQKQKGIPIRTNGNGTGWMTKAADVMMPQLSDEAIKYMGTVIDLELEKIKI